MLRQVLPPTAVLVGMNIRKDIEWLGLLEGVDYAACIDLADLFRVYNPDKRSYTYFSLDHVVLYITFEKAREKRLLLGAPQTQLGTNMN